MDSKCRELQHVTSQLQQSKTQQEKAQQVNDDTRAKLMDKELEVESLEVGALSKFLIFS